MGLLFIFIVFFIILVTIQNMVLFLLLDFIDFLWLNEIGMTNIYLTYFKLL
ncbi:hypothetical protein ECENHK_14235 [Enterobacter kobei]|nr:hypothetical protein ECENHK_14235 [Enterobacter kobei]